MRLHGVEIMRDSFDRSFKPATGKRVEVMAMS
jgi:hypothetical protein